MPRTTSQKYDHKDPLCSESVKVLQVANVRSESSREHFMPGANVPKEREFDRVKVLGSCN